MQNEKTTQQLIREYEANMPPEIMEMIGKFDWKRELRTIVMQNQLPIDVGADLEQSVYLMLLGVATVEDVYEDLTEIHELSEDRTKKVLEEIEQRIFNVLHKKLIELEEKVPESIVSQAQKDPVIEEKKQNVVLKDEEPEDRDTILAEIEKEEDEKERIDAAKRPIIDMTKQTNSLSNSLVSESTPIEAPKEAPPADPLSRITYKKPEAANIASQTTQDPYQSSGVARPFSMETQADDDVIITEDPVPTQSEKVIGVQEDPVSSGLNKSTMIQKQETSSSSVQQAPKPKVQDPYREPIE